MDRLRLAGVPTSYCTSESTGELLKPEPWLSHMVPAPVGLYECPDIGILKSSEVESNMQQRWRMCELDTRVIVCLGWLQFM